MDFIIGALTEYWHAFRDASRGFFQQRAVAGVLFLYFAIMGIASTFLEGFGMAGSLIMCGIRCGCIISTIDSLRFNMSLTWQFG